MLRTRLWMGALLILVGLALLVVDQYLAPWYPSLFLVSLAAMEVSCLQVLGLLGPSRRLPAWFCCAAVGLVVAANWPPLM